MKKALLVFLITGINVSQLSGHIQIEQVTTATFLIYVGGHRQWRLLLCGVLFFLLSYGHIALSLLPQLSQFPAIGMILIVGISFLIVYTLKPARVWASWARVGKFQISTILTIIGIGIISSLALIFWARWTDNLGIAVKMAEGIRYYPKVLMVVLLIPCFACLNALIEEIVYRGVLQEALSEGFTNKHLIVALQASAFAAFHFASGFPNGVSGYILTLLYGSVLGYLREESKGLLAPILCHILADLTIFYYMASLIWQT